MKPARIVLVGAMGSGKSTVASALAKRLGWELVDTDELVEQLEEASVPEIFDARGEAAFRASELSALRSVLELDERLVVATGGGIVEGVDARTLLAAEPQVAWLRVDPAVALERIGDTSGRPLLSVDPEQAIAALVERRRPLYQEVADLVIDVDDLTVDDVVDEILVGFEVAP